MAKATQAPRRKRTSTTLGRGSAKHAVGDAIREAIRKKARGETTVSVIAAGELLGLGRDAAYAAAESGALPTLKICARRWRVSTAVIERLLLGDDR